MADTLLTTPPRLNEEPVSPPPASRSNSRLISILGGAALLLAIVAFATWHYYSNRESTDDAQIDGHIHPIGPRVGGTVTEVRFEINQYVDAGQVLVQLDTKDYEVAVARAKADLAEAEAGLRATESQVSITSETTGSQTSDAEAALEEARSRLVTEQSNTEASKAKLVMAQARAREAEANDQRASKDLERLKPLIAKEEISQQQYDAAFEAAESSRASVDAAQAAVNDAQIGIQVSESHVRTERAKLAQAEASLRSAQTGPQQVAQTKARTSSAQAVWERAKAALQQAELNLAYATIRAPISGVASRKSVEVGQNVQPGQPLFALVSLDDVWVNANFKETQLRNMRPGQRVVVSVDAYGKKYDGHIESVSAATGARFSMLPPENASGNFVKVVQRIPVKIVFEKGQDPDHVLRPGMSVVPTVITR